MMNKDKNEEEKLREIFENAPKSVLLLFEEKKKAFGGDLPTKKFQSVKRGPKGQGLIFPLPERRNNLVIFKNWFWNEILQLNSSKGCISEIENSSIFREVINATISIQNYPYYATAENILGSFLETYLANQIDLHFNEEQFSKTYEIMLKSIRDDFVTVETFIPIERFTMDNDYIELIDGWTIQRVSDERLGELIPDWHKSGERSMDLGMIQFALVRVSKEKRLVFKKKRPKSEVKEPVKPDVIMTTLRVLKEGFCSFSNWRRKPIDWLFYRHSISLGFRSTNIPSPTPLHRYHLNTDEIEELKEYIEMFRYLEEREALEVPIRRFNFGSERESGYDQLIDYMIALESLYLQLEGELSFRFSLRVSTFVGGSREERSELFNLLRLAYSLRSKIVHGVSSNKINRYLKKEGHSFGTLLIKVEDLLRYSIIRFAKLVKSSLSVKNIIESIDDALSQGVSFSQYLQDIDKNQDS